MTGQGFTSSALVCPTDQSTVLTAIVATIRASVEQFSSESTCFVSSTPWLSVEVNGNECCTVTPGGGDFDGGLTIGAGEYGIRESSRVTVSIWSRIQSDQLERADAALMDVERGLLVMKRQILKALAGKQLYADFPENTQPLLIEYLRPLNATEPDIKESEDDFSSIAIVFDATFDWDLQT